MSSSQDEHLKCAQCALRVTISMALDAPPLRWTSNNSGLKGGTPDSTVSGEVIEFALIIGPSGRQSKKAIRECFIQEHSMEYSSFLTHYKKLPLAQ